MKVRISFTVDVDAEEWMKRYGVFMKDVRESVKEKARQDLVVHWGPSGLDVLKSDS